MYFFVLFSYFPSSLSAGVKCLHLKLLVAIQESANENTREGKEKVVLVLELNYSKFQNARLRRAENGRKIPFWK